MLEYDEQAIYVEDKGNGQPLYFYLPLHLAGEALIVW